MTHRLLRSKRLLDGSIVALTVVVLLAAAEPMLAQSRARDRIVESVDREHFSVMRGHLRPGLTPRTDLGALPGDMRLGGVTMFFQRSSQQQTDLDTLLAQQQDPSSANFHRWLTPEEFGDRFGLTQGDVDKIVAWLQSQGLTVQAVSRSRTWVTFSGTAQQVQAALRTELHRYTVSGEMHFAAGREPSVPAALAGVVMGFRGLDDFRLKPQAVMTVEPRLTSGISGSHFLTPGDLATIYNLPSLDGSGQTIVVVGQTAINISDVQKFRALSGLPVNDPQIALVPGSADPGMVIGDIDEANLDLDWVGAVARKATIKYVYADPNNNTGGVINALFYAIDNNLAAVISISYGNCEGGPNGFTQANANTLAAEAQKANALGITIVAPAGDNGAADCDSTVPVRQGLSIDLPGGLPYVTSVGGTRFNGDANDPPVSSGFWLTTPYDPTKSSQTAGTAISYIPETSWNESTSTALAATGGGSSIYFPKPSWQTGTGVPADGARDVPDISFNASGAHDSYIACSEDNTSTTSPPSWEASCENGFRRVRPGNTNFDQSFAAFGGTSAGVPIFAGVVALINQQAGSRQGNVNPKLYAMAGTSANAFHDVTSGNNTVSYQPMSTLLPNCAPTGSTTVGYLAGTGYDLVTGLGSVNMANLVSNWTGVSAPAAGNNLTANFALAINPAALTVKRGACGSVAVVLTRNSGFAGTPTFTCSVAAPLTAATCSVSPVASAAAPGLQLEPRSQRWWPMGMLAAGVCLAILLLAAIRTRRPSTQIGWTRWAPGFAATCLLAFAIGCGGGGGSSSSGSSNTNPSSNTTPPTSNYVFTLDAPASATVGTATVTVTGAIGGVSHSATLNLTVN